MSRWSIRFALVLLLLAIAVALALTAAWMTLPLDGTTHGAIKLGQVVDEHPLRRRNDSCQCLKCST